MENEIIISIDFGTTNIKVAEWKWKKDEVGMVKLANNADKIKNVLHYNENKKLIWGTSAYNKLSDKNTVSNIKQKLEDEKWDYYFPNLDAKKTAIEIVADVFKEIKAEIKEQKGQREEVSKAILTVPVYFSEIQKERLREAARIADLNVIEIILEPVAAALSYLEEDEIDDDVYVGMIFDFGGGTLDLTFYRHNTADDINEFTILNSTGVKFGGNNIDQLILHKIVIPKWKVEYESIPAEDKEKVKKDLIKQIEVAKENLFSDEDEDSAELIMSNIYKQLNINISFTKDEVINIFNEEGLVEQIQQLVKGMLFETELSKKEVKIIHAVGGSSKIDYFQQVLTDFFENDDILKVDEDDELFNATAIGACNLLKEIITDNNQITLKNSVPFNIGYKDGDDFVTAVHKNDAYEFFSIKKFLCNVETIKLNKTEIVLTIFQKFNHNKEDEIVYIGNFMVDSSKFDEEIQFKIGTDRFGEIKCRFFNGYDEKPLVEEKLKIQI